MTVAIPIQEQEREIRLFRLQWHYSPFCWWQGFCLCATQQTDVSNRRGHPTSAVSAPIGELRIWYSYFAKIKRNAGNRTRVSTPPLSTWRRRLASWAEAYFCESWIEPDALPSYSWSHPSTIPHRPAGWGEAQRGVLQLVPHWEWCKAGLCPRTNTFCNLLRHDVSRNKLFGPFQTRIPLYVYSYLQNYITLLNLGIIVMYIVCISTIGISKHYDELR